MKKQVTLIIILAFAAGLLFSKVLSKSHDTKPIPVEAHQHKIYQCPMHPSVTADHPDKCPICGMDLQRVDEPENSMPKEHGIIYYRNPMRPDVTSKVPSKDEMGMDYIPVYEDEGGGYDSNVQGRSSFTLSKERQQLIGVTTAKVTKQTLNSEIRANGSVAFDPDLFTAISEYRQALAGRNAIKDNSFLELRDDANQLIGASRTRLRLLGLTDTQINGLATAKSNPMNLLLPKGHAWIYAEVFEYEVSGIKVGQEIEVTSPTVSGKSFIGKISSISPVLNATTRTIRVRGLVPDPEEALRPESYVDVRIKSAIGEKLAVPEDAVLHSGDHNFIFVVKDEGKFEPREVKVGIKTREFYEIISGVEEGEAVVTAAQFLIDSESRLRSALQNLKPGNESSHKGGVGK